MSVDYYHCEVCGESIYEEYVGSCVGCGNRLCTSCLINNDVNSDYAFRYGYKFDSNNQELIDELIKKGFHLKDENNEFHYKDGEIIDESAILEKYCPFCNGDMIDHKIVLNYLLNKYKLNIKKVWQEIKLKK